MKLSRYTFLFDCEGSEFYIYNSLSNALIETDADTYGLLKTNRKDISEEMIDPEFFQALLERNILTDNDEDEFLKYKAYILRMRSQRASMHLTLAPTMDCCFSCHYCFEKYKTKHRMSSGVMDAIVKYVLSCRDLERLKLTWFGGEPLMAVPQIEQFYDKFSAVWTKPFSSDVITTGYHIDREAIRVLKKVGVTSVQITLDGLRDTHNRVKHFHGSGDVFEKVLSNIELLNDLAPEINIVIRVNLTHENAHEYIPLFRLYLDRFKGRTNMGIAPAFVLDRGVSECRTCAGQSKLFNHKQRSEFVLALNKMGIDSPFARYPERFFYECAIRNDMAISFDAEGYAYKCWEIIGNKEYAIGKLNEEGCLTAINEKLMNRQLYGADPLEDPACSACRYLPICNGGCPIQRIQNKFENADNDNCTFYKGYMADFLKAHIERKKMQKDQ